MEEKNEAGQNRSGCYPSMWEAGTREINPSSRPTRVPSEGLFQKGKKWAERGVRGSVTQW